MKAFIQNLVHKGTVVTEKIRFEFLYVYELGPRSRNDLDLKYSYTFTKVNPGSLFEQTKMGWSPRCYIPSFMEIGPSVLEKMFEGFLSYMGMAAILVM